MLDASVAFATNNPYRWQGYGRMYTVSHSEKPTMLFTVGRSALNVRRIRVMALIVLLVGLPGCAAATAGVTSATLTASSLTVSAIGATTSAVYRMGKAGLSALAP